jgi:hypothetical protein
MSTVKVIKIQMTFGVSRDSAFEWAAERLRPVTGKIWQHVLQTTDMEPD